MESRGAARRGAARGVSAVRGGRSGPSLPHLELHALIAAQGQPLLEEVHANRLLIHALEAIIDEPRNDRRFAHGAVAEQAHLALGVSRHAGAARS